MSAQPVPADPPRDAASLMARVIRDDVQAMQAYAVPDATGLVKLDAMENPFGLPHDLRKALAQRLAAVPMNRYPAPRADALRATIRRVMQVPGGCDVLLGNGSDELIALVCMAVARDGASVLSLAPAFAMFEISARLARLKPVMVPLRDDFSLDLAATIAALRSHRPAVAFIAYPNNPTGNLFDRADIEVVLDTARWTDTLVIVDEAYNAFASDSFMADLPRHDNLLVLRTVSKSGLAGVRLGYLCGAPTWLEPIDKVRPPYNVNALTQCAAQFALEHADVLDAQAAILREQRGRLMAALQALAGVTPFDSQANFILFRIDSADATAATRVFDALRRRRVLIKNLSKAHPLCANALRVTVSIPDENATFLAALASSLHEVLPQ